MTDGVSCVPNIGGFGIKRRRRVGRRWLAGTAVIALGLLVLGVHPAWHLLLIAGFGRGLLGVLQAREKT